MHRTRQVVVALAALVAVVGVALTDAHNAPTCAQGNACVSSCRAAHNQCRIATKGSASCDAQLQACVQACVKG